MESWDWLRQDWSYLFKLVATLLLLILYVAVVSVTNICLGRYAKKHHLAYRRLIYARKFVNILLFLLFFPLVLGFWGINLKPYPLCGLSLEDRGYHSHFRWRQLCGGGNPRYGAF